MDAKTSASCDPTVIITHLRELSSQVTTIIKALKYRRVQLNHEEYKSLEAANLDLNKTIATVTEENIQLFFNPSEELKLDLLPVQKRKNLFNYLIEFLTPENNKKQLRYSTSLYKILIILAAEQLLQNLIKFKAFLASKYTFKTLSKED
ncbi:hypothetical protein BO71DRAFT_448992 [Aspergillus ellipticus CBS 707.79]|uniref:Uncharacterized protein n=1 Tax=Aspergillus ellipticus CBS 707.79 TaxID=1448320 RepID=A0A319DFF3_9EURO|nr:hypothetical protein BO71DRAFT_448992 [Aspergillus ellipticus CBS 707.79]